MDWKTQYQEKLRTPAQAVQVVRNGDRIYAGTSSSIAYPLIDALYQRRDELEGVVLCHGMINRQLPIFTPEAKGHFSTTTYFAGAGCRTGIPERPDYFYLLPPQSDRPVVPRSRPAQHRVFGGVAARRGGLHDLRRLRHHVPRLCPGTGGHGGASGQPQRALCLRRKKQDPYLPGRYRGGGGGPVGHGPQPAPGRDARDAVQPISSP